jgi:hypothetical protein
MDKPTNTTTVRGWRGTPATYGNAPECQRCFRLMARDRDSILNHDFGPAAWACIDCDIERGEHRG